MSTGRKIWSIIYPILLYFLVTVIVSAIMEFAALFIYKYNIYDMQEMIAEVPGLMLMITFVTYLVSLVLFFIIFRKERKMSGKTDDPLTAKRVIITIAVCLGISLVLQILLNISRIDEVFPGYQNVVNTTFAGQPLLLLILSVGIVGPITEELLFRGLIFDRLDRYLGTRPAVIISALIFGAVHLNMVQFIYATIIGILFAYFYSRYRNIWIPIIAHITVNMAGVVLMALGY